MASVRHRLGSVAQKHTLKYGLGRIKEVLNAFVKNTNPRFEVETNVLDLTCTSALNE